jgi:hypothetical protein
MRIVGPNGPTATTTKPSVRRTSSGTFSLPESEAPSAPAGTANVSSVAGIDALIALQGVEETPVERRRRAAARGRVALDALDEMKVALLSGSLDPEIAARLRTTLEGLTEVSGDPGLDAVLGEIELRVAVELAKMEGPFS